MQNNKNRLDDSQADNRDINWVVSEKTEQHGNVLLRLGKDYKNDFVLAIYSTSNGVQRGTFVENVDENILTIGNIKQLVAKHLDHLKPMLPPVNELVLEDNWFKIVEVTGWDKILVDWAPCDKKITLTCFTQDDKTFWSESFLAEHLESFGLEQYDEDFEQFYKLLDSNLVRKLMSKGLREEDWIL